MSTEDESGLRAGEASPEPLSGQRHGWSIHTQAVVVECPECAFTMGIDHEESDKKSFRCPACSEVAAYAAFPDWFGTSRVLGFDPVHGETEETIPLAECIAGLAKEAERDSEAARSDDAEVKSALVHAQPGAAERAFYDGWGAAFSGFTDNDGPRTKEEAWKRRESARAKTEEGRNSGPDPGTNAPLSTPGGGSLESGTSLPNAGAGRASDRENQCKAAYWTPGGTTKIGRPDPGETAYCQLRVGHGGMHETAFGFRWLDADGERATPSSSPDPVKP